MIARRSLAVILLTAFGAALLPRLRRREPAPLAADTVLVILALVGLSFAAALRLGSFAWAYSIDFVLFAAIAVLFDAFARQRFPAAQLVAAVSALLMLVAWRSPDGVQLLWFLLPVTVLFVAGALRGLLRDTRPLYWSQTLCLTLAAAYLAGMIDLNGWIGGRDLPHAWAILALLLAASMVAAAVVLPRRGSSPELVRGVFAAAASGFLSMAVALEVSPGLYALSAALQVLGLALLHWRYRLPMLRWLAGVYTGLYALLDIVGYLHPAPPTSTILMPAEISLPREIYHLPSFADQPWLLLVVPALAFLAASTVLLRVARSGIVDVLDGLAVALLALGIYYLIAPSPFLPAEMYARTAWWLLAELALAAVAIGAGRQLKRPSLVLPGAVLAVIAALACLGFEALPVFWFWPDAEIVGPPLFNSALLALGGGAVLLLAAVRLLVDADGTRFKPLARFGLGPVAGFLIFTLLLVEIRHAFHGATLQGGIDQLELYCYSAGMLVFGFVVLAVGIALRSQPARALSLAFVLATVGKVFLYDVSGLEGLWRIASFLALGLSLLAVSWFYGRFVFGLGTDGRQREAGKSP